jgi:hypothetical protein
VEANRITMKNMFTVLLVEDIDVFQGKVFSDCFQPSSDRDRVLDVEIQRPAFLFCAKKDKLSGCLSLSARCNLSEEERQLRRRVEYRNFSFGNAPKRPADCPELPQKPGFASA